MIYDYCAYAYLNIVSSEKQSSPKDFLKTQFVNFRC